MKRVRAIRNVFWVFLLVIISALTNNHAGLSAIHKRFCEHLYAQPPCSFNIGRCICFYSSFNNLIALTVWRYCVVIATKLSNNSSLISCASICLIQHSIVRWAKIFIYFNDSFFHLFRYMWRTFLKQQWRNNASYKTVATKFGKFTVAYTVHDLNHKPCFHVYSHAEHLNLLVFSSKQVALICNSRPFW